MLNLGGIRSMDIPDSLVVFNPCGSVIPIFIYSQHARIVPHDVYTAFFFPSKFQVNVIESQANKESIRRTLLTPKESIGSTE